MLILKNEQLEVFKATSLKQFEDEMFEHIRNFFPNQFADLKESGVRAAIKTGASQAIKYGFKGRRNICHYLNAMMVLGQKFDEDKRYPWAMEILNNKNELTGDEKMKKLNDRILIEVSKTPKS